MRVTTGREAEVGHVVGLVEHGDLDGVETDELLLHEVFEATGAGDDDVDSGLESLNLAVLRDTTEDRGHAQVVCGGQRFEGCGDLGGELNASVRAPGRAVDPDDAFLRTVRRRGGRPWGWRTRGSCRFRSFRGPVRRAPMRSVGEGCRSGSGTEK